MELLAQFTDLVLHLDAHLTLLIREYGLWIYPILFLVIFSETGLVVFPFLPGDSLLFVAGALAAVGDLHPGLLILVLTLAAVLGNSVNYAIGRRLGPRVFQWPDSRFFNRAALDRTHAFYQRHGGKTIVLSRFLPVFRTFAPFVAGVGAMEAGRFTAFNLFGAALWVASLVLAGYWLGNVPLIRNNLTATILAIVVISLLPAVIGWWRHRAAARA